MTDNRVAEQHVTDLLNSHRNTLLGVQILLAGMLGLPFTAAFARLQSDLEAAYVLAVLAAAVASAFLIAPSQYHRLHTDRPEATLRVGRLCGTAGTLALGVSVVSVVFMLMRFVVGTAFGTAAAVGLAALVAVLWFVLPAVGRRG